MLNSSIWRTSGMKLSDDIFDTHRMVAEALVDRAINGDVMAIREVYDRVEGKPKQTIDVNVEERKREMVEDAIARMIEEAQVSREEAIEQLTAFAPEMSKWIN